MPVEIRGFEYAGLYQLLERSAEEFPNALALVGGSRRISYAKFSEEVDHLSAFLHFLGVRPGDNVCLYLPNSIEFLASYFAIWRLGATAVPVNYMWKREELGYVVKDSGSAVILTDSQRFVMVEGLRSENRRIRHVVDVESVAKKEGIYPIPDPALVKEHQCAVIIYTSGTTGRPKGAMLSHHNILSNIASCSLAISFSRKDRVPCLLPLFHSFGLTVCALTPVAVGARIVFVNPAQGVKAIVKGLIKERATILVGIPPLFSIMADAKLPKLPRFLIRWILPIRVAISGSSALDPGIIERFQNKYGIPLLEGYGLTEASPVVSLNPISAPRSGSVGLPIKDVEVKIVDEHGQECPAGRVGEILVKGPNVMLGYYRRPLETRETIRNGWLRTGDLGYKDRDGYIYIVGRKKEMIIVRGLNVYPREVEAVLNKLPGVKESAVVGVKHRTKGEVPYAFVVLKKGWDLSPREIQAYLKSKLADYKVPQRIILLDELPKNTLRKVQKDRLLAMLKEGLD